MSDWADFLKKDKRTIFNQCLGSRRLIELIIHYTPQGGTILEVGCGTALLTLVLADYGFQTTAIDTNEEVLRYARERINILPKSIHLMKADILNLSTVFKERRFDTVCSKGVMEHFSDNDIVQGLREQRNIASRLIFHVPNIRAKITHEFFGDERLLTNKKWVALIKAAGFRQVNIFGGYDLPKLSYLILPGVFFNKKLSFWWKWFSGHSIFVCE
jgi:2-polyprenyl-3-methyl-5-hydroxy-6-metoxy-1,4-benzoquinol methylase